MIISTEIYEWDSHNEKKNRQYFHEYFYMKSLCCPRRIICQFTRIAVTRLHFHDAIFITINFFFRIDFNIGTRSIARTTTLEEAEKKIKIRDGRKRGLCVFEMNVGQFSNSTINWVGKELFCNNARRNEAAHKKEVKCVCE